MVGSITADDAAFILNEKTSGDLFNLSGVSEDDLHQKTIETAKARWLFINLLTALMASSVIGIFDGVIEQFIALAILLPITASMGGNAGTQTLAITIQAMLLGAIIAIAMLINLTVAGIVTTVTDIVGFV